MTYNCYRCKKAHGNNDMAYHLCHYFNGEGQKLRHPRRLGRLYRRLSEAHGFSELELHSEAIEQGYLPKGTSFPEPLVGELIGEVHIGYNSEWPLMLQKYRDGSTFVKFAKKPRKAWGCYRDHDAAAADIETLMEARANGNA